MAIDYELTGSRWGTGPAGTSAGTITWAADSTIEATWLPQIRAAFADWSRYANIDFKEVAAASTPDISFTETYIDGPLQYLGYATWTYDAGQRLTHATIKIDSADDYHSVGNTVVASSNPKQDLFHLVLHEIGHAIGIDHRPVNEGLSVMNPSINPAAVKDLTSSDIEAVQALYGVRAGSPSFNAQTGLATQTVAQAPVASPEPAATNAAAALVAGAPEYVLQVARLYEAGLDRRFDSQGLDYWIKARESGMQFTEMARQFLDSPEFSTRYGDDDKMSNAAFIELMYSNVLNRHSEQGGFIYWSNAMQSGATREDVLMGFSESAENRAQVSYLSSLHQVQPDHWSL